MILFRIISILLFLYIGFNVLYVLIFSIAGLTRKQPKYSAVVHKKKFVILIPSYREDQIILETARQVIAQDYPKSLFDVVVIADQLQQQTLSLLSQLPIRLIKVSFEKSTKAKSLKYALQQLPDNQYDIAMILDADNIMGPGCLEKINHAFQGEYEMVQLHRTAKNRNTPTAVLDAASEEINNHIFRRGHRALGLSSALIGSGMAFNYVDFKTLMLETDIENNPGEDREIFLELTRKGKICEYIEDAMVYDEKVQSGQVLEKQRTRWISAQLQYARRFWISEFSKTFTYNIHYFDYALQTLLLPRVIMLTTSFFLFILNVSVYFLTGSGTYPGVISWAMLFLGCILSLSISIYPYISVKEFWIALNSLPGTVGSFFSALLKSRSNQKEFIHTPKEFIKYSAEKDYNTESR